ncbi:MAG: TonB C-terminal domain-containing protein [Gallionella sp.]|nr:TonB C-terminal domain-containing protein [Gallionella sp.]
MNTVVSHEPYKLPAGLLALLVHAAFFALLYFGFSWQAEPPATLSVELWQSLPEVTVAPPAEAKVEEVLPPPAKVEEVIKPDIVIPDKKPKIEPRPVEKPPEKLIEKPKAKPEVKKEVRKEPVQAAQPSAAELQVAREAVLREQAVREQAAQEAATGRVIDEFAGKIKGKIRRNIVMPPDVASDARAEFLVTVLPGGTVLNARLLKSSGNAVYDIAVERAIIKSQPLPLPADAGLFKRFRELKLGFQPVE